jgi:hypothetical protein
LSAVLSPLLWLPNALPLFLSSEYSLICCLTLLIHRVKMVDASIPPSYPQSHLIECT